MLLRAVLFSLIPVAAAAVSGLVAAIRPPGRHTRSSSSAARWWCGANITPTHESTTSKLSSA